MMVFQFAATTVGASSGQVYLLQSGTYGDWQPAFRQVWVGAEPPYTVHTRQEAAYNLLAG